MKVKCPPPINPILLMNRRGHRGFQRVAGNVCMHAGSRGEGAVADFQSFGESGGVLKALNRGVGSVTFARATEATVTDFERLDRTVPSNCLRPEYGRIVRNLATGLVTETVTVINGAEYQLTIRGDNGATAVCSGAFTGTLTADGSNRISWSNGTPKTASTTSLTITVTGSLTQMLLEEVSGQANQNPSENVSVGVATGSEVVVDTDFSNESAWDTVNASVTFSPPSGIDINYSGSFNNLLIQESGCTAGKTYVYSFTVNDYTSGIGVIRIGNTQIENVEAAGTYTGSVIAASTGSKAFSIQGSAFVASFSEVSVKEADHGLGVDAIKAFSEQNATTVDINGVVNGAKGAAITDWRWLFEPAATNEIASPMDFTAGANWTGTGNLDGSVSTLDSSVQGYKLWRLEESGPGSTGEHTYFSNTFTKANQAQTWVASVICRPDEVPWMAIQAENSAGSNFFQQFFNMSTGAKGTSNNSTWNFVDSGSEQRANGDYRFWVKGTTDTGTTVRLRIYAADSDNGSFFNLGAGEGFYVQGAQLEQSEAVTSLITTGSFTRTADDASGMFAYANWSQTEGTWYTDFWLPQFVSETVGIFSVANNDDGVLYKAGTAQLRSSDDGGATASAVTISSPTGYNRYRGVSDFGTGSTLEVGYRDIDGTGSFVWDGTPENYDGAFVTDSVINIAYQAKIPVRLRDLQGYTTRKGKQWVEDNL